MKSFHPLAPILYFRTVLKPDSFRHKGLRRKLIEQLRQKGISDPRILDAMDRLPRHWFVDSAFVDHAYEDQPLGIGHGQTISQPYTVAYQTWLLQVEPRMKVLEIGTGSGYQAALLATLGARVFTIERQEALWMQTSALLQDLGLERIRVFLRDGYKGLPEFAPFERILVTAGAPQVPQALLDQLCVGGKLVIPVGDGQGQIMRRITRSNEKEWQEEDFGKFAFVPFLPGIKKQ